MKDTLFYGNSRPKIGIRAIIDGRDGLREMQSEPIRRLADRLAGLVSAHVFYADGEPVQCVVSSQAIGSPVEAERVSEEFSRENVGGIINIARAWSYPCEVMHYDTRIPQAVWGFSGSDAPGTVFMGALVAAAAQEGLPFFKIYGEDIQDKESGEIPEDVAKKLIRFGQCAIAMATMRGRAYLCLGTACMGIGSSVPDQSFFRSYLGMRAQCVDMTEIARRLAKLVHAPFLKVEATKYTEVGYVGRDVESMVRDLAECAIRLVREEKTAEVEYKARATAERKVAKVLAENNKADRGELSKEVFEQNFVDAVHEGKYDHAMIEIDVADQPKPLELSAGGGSIDLGSIFGGMGLPGKRKRRKLTVKEAVNLLMAEEADKLIDNDAVNAEAIRRAENDGIIFIDEIDKIAGKGNTSGADVSREGVQRDILPIVEGCTVMTKYGPIKTDYILFIAAGAFHVSKVEDLIPELQGRFPIQVELSSLTKQDFIDILTQPENAITRQYSVLLAVDNIDLKFTPDAIEKIAEIAEDINSTSEDIGARRLHTVMEYLLEDISFNAGGGDYPVIPVEINSKYVEEHLDKMISNRDLKKYVL